MRFSTLIVGFSAVAFANEQPAVARELGHKKGHAAAAPAAAFTYTKGHMHVPPMIDIPTIKGTTHIVPKEKGKVAAPVVVTPTKKGHVTVVPAKQPVTVIPTKQTYTPPTLTYATPVQTGKHGLLRNLHKKRGNFGGKYQNHGKNYVAAAPMKAQPVVSKKEYVQPVITKKAQPVIVQQPIITKKAQPQVVQVVAQPAKKPTYVVQQTGKGHHGHY